MSVAVITPFFNEPEGWLRQCLDSVREQTMPCTHIVVSDGGDLPLGLPAEVQLIRLPRPHADYGNAARAIGAVSAIAQGFEALSWLDADNWFLPHHIASLWELHRSTGSAVCTSARELFTRDGGHLGRCVESVPAQFIDTNCYLVTREAFRLVHEWYLAPKERSFVADRHFWEVLHRSGLKTAHSDGASVCYRTHYAVHYQQFGRVPPADAKPSVSIPSPSQVRLSNEPKPFINAPASTKQTVSLCMIVRNEEANLDPCLRSVRDLVDEAIVVDTGSEDLTREIAIRHSAKVVDFPWVDSFSAARNEALRHATGDWIFWLDADDRLDEVNRSRLRLLRERLPEGNFVFMMKQRSTPDSDAGASLVVDHARMFRKQANVQWTFRLHEQILPSLQHAGAKVVLTDMVIDHVGYNDPALRRRKLARNLRLLKMDVAEHPDNGFVHFNLAGTYLDLSSNHDAIPHLETCILLAPRGASFLAKAHVFLIKTLRIAGKIRDAQEKCRVARESFPSFPELLFEEGLLCEATNDPIGAQKAFEAILSGIKGPQFVGTDEGITGHLARHHLAIAFRNSNRRDAAESQWRFALHEQPKFVPPWLQLFDMLVSQSRYYEAEQLTSEASTSNTQVGSALRAKLQLLRGEPMQAIGTLEQAVASLPDVVWLRMLLCEILIRHGSKSKAAEQLEAILRAKPDFRPAQAKLDELRQRSEPGS